MNGDLISRSAMLEKLDELSELFRQRGETEGNGFLAIQCGVTFAIEEVKQAPAEDAEIVRHARWAPIKDDYGHHYQGQCTNCGCEPLRNFAHSPWSFCPNCGARMDVEAISKTETTTREKEAKQDG